MEVERRNVRVDDIVVVQDPNAIRGNWVTGRIVKVYPGNDGRIRNVKVKTATSSYILFNIKNTICGASCSL